jgi:thioredoxin 1
MMVFVFSYCGNSKSETSSESDQPKSKKTAEPDTIVSSDSIKVTFVELGSVNCIPCKKMMPIMKQIEEEYGDQVEVVFHDVWTAEGKPYARKYRISMIPTQIFLDEKGNEYFRHIGFFPKDELVKALAKGGVTIKKEEEEK